MDFASIRHLHPRIFATKLTRECDESQLHEFFSRWCNVRAAFIAREGDGTSKNFGFVTQDDVKNALSLYGYMWNDRQLVVKMAKHQ